MVDYGLLVGVEREERDDLRNPARDGWLAIPMLTDRRIDAALTGSG